MDGSIASSSNFSASSSSSSSAIFRPRRSDDWNEYRTVIERLYRDHQLKLRDVKRIMEHDYNFVASEKQFKDRLAAWHVRKNIKAKEVHVMIRKQQKRAARGKQTAFRVGGQEVDSKRIARFVRRYGASWDNTRNDSHQTSPEPGENKIDPLQSPELDDNQSLSVATLSPTSTHPTPKPVEDLTTTEDVWEALDSFQDRLLALDKKLEESMSNFITPGEEC
ncbi:Clr5 domain-containing protein [Aspergillus novofumigatus IBT 16806]|uniref:Clr5 domain-containing protein n=1 Tax=Aspergillus novofumigatus (strain IBT 16806) TaxID=1392255 RepID=A0A2I1C086_ASPN1|nr:uncharacterized protein P174DRAFT_376656 [Aspergillus novofumigatus IBT 16806]PKX91029.1 hypothetical protein P174DRAFT_376656 [Aspergillus novofumigatus IBT 16806]